MNDLWELVQVYNVNVGDVIMINPYGHPATIGEGQIDKYGGIALAGYCLHSHDTVFRRIPETEDPTLIAAAPDLLGALEEIVNNAVVNYEGSMDIYSEAIDMARAAIAKAKGGEE